MAEGEGAAAGAPPAAACELMKAMIACNPWASVWTRWRTSSFESCLNPCGISKSAGLTSVYRSRVSMMTLPPVMPWTFPEVWPKPSMRSGSPVSLST